MNHNRRISVPAAVRPVIETVARRTLLSLLFTASALAGCQRSYRETMRDTVNACSQGRYAEASKVTAGALAGIGEDDDDRLVYLIEAGRTAQMAGDIAASDKALRAASDFTRPYLDEKAEASAFEAGKTTVFNQTLSLYRGTNPDRTLIETLLAMNAMVRGDQDAARIALNRAKAWQEVAVALNEREIADRQGEIDAKKAEAKTKNVQYGSGSEVESNANYGNLSSLQAYADYADPFATYLRGLFLLFQSDAADLENADYAFRRTQALHEGNAAVAAQVQGDLAMVEEMRSTGRIAPQTWVILLEGLSVHREQFSLGVAAFPYMVQTGAAVDAPALLAVGGTQPMAVVSDIDRMVMADFKQKLPLIITQEILSTALKTGVTYVLSEKFGALGAGAGAVFQFASTAADLRSWRTAPKRIHVARIPTPADGMIAVQDGGRTVASLPVAAGSSSIVFVDMPSRGAPAAFRTAALRPATAATANPAGSAGSAESTGSTESAESTGSTESAEPSAALQPQSEPTSAASGS